ncbi:pantothenate kinase pank [Tricharina praecox]|uniref:pantothenate kinase pank n=1 Tax=Tricharina praecox TaxID=43433 RepID=UPI002220B023|nr:pantothenate kinase pank [Tricharina praecox]KAI5845502.1 pantothenate kinase pank [Tricharina praecox]
MSTNVETEVQAISTPGAVTLPATEYHGPAKIYVKGAHIVDGSESEETLRTTGPVPRDIRLPHHQSSFSHMAIDIGGSLAKLVYFTRDPHGKGGRLNFKSFETEKIDELIAFMGALIRSSEWARPPGKEKIQIMATGGGAYKYAERIQNAIGVEIRREDEMECLIGGLDFFSREIPREVFSYTEDNPMHFSESKPDAYPYMLVNIGSGVSILMVTGPDEFKRVGGSSLGGGTLWGLLSKMTDAKTFDEMLALAQRGDNTKVDMLVEDIYGGGYDKIGLKPTTIASSFGKVFKMQSRANKYAAASANDVSSASSDCASCAAKRAESPVGNPSHSTTNGVSDAIPAEDQSKAGAATVNGGDEKSRFGPEDISRSLLYAISNNIGQLAYLHAQINHMKHIYFGGSFIRGHHETMHTLTYAIRFWSQGEKKAYFLRHEGYLGAVGAFLRHPPLSEYEEDRPSSSS